MKSGNTKVATDRLFHRLNNIQRDLKLEEDHHYFDDCGDGDGDGGQPNWFIVHFHSLTGHHLKKIKNCTVCRHFTYRTNCNGKPTSIDRG